MHRVGMMFAGAIALFFASASRGQEAHAQGAAPIVNSQTYTHPAQLVRVEGHRRLNMLCMGQGSPTVVLVSGGDSNIMIWHKVQAQMGRFVRVCTFDKAGFGFSDASRHTSSTGNDVEDIRRLLDAAKIARPVVLVGHSLGGQDAVLFAGRYRQSVAGMVLVDPSYPGQVRAFSSVVLSAAEVVENRKNKLAWVKDMTECVRQAKAGRLNPATDKQGCLDKDYPDDPILQATLDRQEMTAQNEAAQLSEGVNASPLADTRPDVARDPFETQDDRDTLGASTDFGDMPLIVLTRDVDAKCASDHICAAGYAIWKSDHDRIATYSKIGKSLVVAGAGHVIEVDKPDAVVSAVREVVEATRRDR